MEAPTREKIFEMAAQKLRQDFRELQTVPHAALRGLEAEELVRSFLQDHIPRRFNVGSGFILDQTDKVSKQTDIIIFDALNCPTYRTSESAAIYPANNVAAVIEVKSRLDGKELDDAFKKIASVKSLAKVRSSAANTLKVDQTHGSIFAFETAISLDNILERYSNWIKTNGIGHHTDVVCVLDRGLFTTVASFMNAGWATVFLEGLGGPAAEGAHLGIGVHQMGDATLDGFFRLLLANLTFFRNFVDHPGFNWKEHLPYGSMKITYLTSITNETDPEKRQKKLQEYADMVHEEFAKKSVPPDWPK